MSTNLSIRIEMLAARAKGCDFAVLQYNRETDQMEYWRWPSYGAMYIKPKDLRKHRDTHYVLGPNCLCPLKDNSMPDFVEAAIYSVSKGPLAGKYVSSCAEDNCGYFVFMEEISNRPGVPSRSYEPRPSHEQAPPLITHKSERKPLKRSYAMLDINAPDLVANRAALAPPMPTRIDNRKGTSELLALLDSRVRPGIPKALFRGLFVVCACGHYCTKRVFKHHICAREVIDLTEEVIDLTGET